MVSPFAFKGRIGPFPYALGSFAVFFSQHVVVLGALRLLDQPLTCIWSSKAGAHASICTWLLLVMPLRSIAELGLVSIWLLILALAYWLIASWMLAALAFRRAADADLPESVAAFAIAPIVQIPAILLLCVLPSRRAADAGGAVVERDVDWETAAQGMLAGVGLTLASVAIGALAFGSYGFGMFVVSPFVIGATTAYLANRNGDIGFFHTALLVGLATVLGGIALVAAALEGIVCIALAAPLGIAVALVGGAFGRAVAVYSKHPGSQTLASIALLPLVFAVEHVVSVTTAFDTQETVLVNAPPEVVWNSIIYMDALDEPLALPFQLGVAHPLGGRFAGEGVGAIRYGEFSTGTALERVTEWEPDRRLAFVVLNDVPAMHELSPYSHVHAPHVIGYFTTKSTSFELVPHPDGRTEINERTSHELRLDPIFYWLPFARWMVHENNARVLEHIKRQSEREARL
jgi:hypothetical protein